MPGIVRQLDTHVGHAGILVPFHKTYYATGSANVFVNNRKVVRKSDSCACGDAALGASPTVFVNNLPVHRLADGTSGHGLWVPNSAGTASSDVFADS